MKPLVLDLAALAHYNAGVRAAVAANRYRPRRERWLEALFVAAERRDR